MLERFQPGEAPLSASKIDRPAEAADRIDEISGDEFVIVRRAGGKIMLSLNLDGLIPRLMS